MLRTGLSKGDTRNRFGAYHCVITTHTACVGPGDIVARVLLEADVLTELMTGWSVPCHPLHLPGHLGRQRPSSSSGLFQALRFLPMPSPMGLIHFQTPEGSGSFHLSPPHPPCWPEQHRPAVPTPSCQPGNASSSQPQSQFHTWPCRGEHLPPHSHDTD